MMPARPPPIHREGWIFVGVGAVTTIGLAFVNVSLGWIGLLVTVWIAYFFRDPERVTPRRAGLVVSPADGRVIRIDEAPPPTELGMVAAPMVRVAIFMNVFDVHVNRMPITATVTRIAYHPGRFFNASLDKSSEHNERQSFRLVLDDGREIAMVQIAGLVARRILTWVREGDMAKTGVRFGMIRFGSRVDVYLPAGTVPVVLVGQRAIAGETLLADLGRAAEAPRRGVVR
jgi:phosphatidylserine decarboxylase